MTKIYKLWELEEGKEYMHISSSKRYSVRNGELYSRYETGKLSPHPELFTLSGANDVEFTKVNESFNPYSLEFNKVGYTINSKCELCTILPPTTEEDLDSIHIYSNRHFADWKIKERKLLNTLEKFSYENGGSEIDWRNWGQEKYRIIVDFEHGIVVRWVRYIRDLGQVYFISREVAEKALEKYRDLIEEVYFSK